MKTSMTMKMATFAQLLFLLSLPQQTFSFPPADAATGSTPSANAANNVDWRTFDHTKYIGPRDKLLPLTGSKYKSSPIFPINPSQKGIVSVFVNGEEYPVGIFAHEGTKLAVCKKDKSCVSVVAPPAGSLLRVNRGIGVPSCTIYGTTDYTPINYGDCKLSQILSGGQIYYYGDPRNSGVKNFFWDLNRMFFYVNPKDSAAPRLMYLNPGESICIFTKDGSSAKLVKAPVSYLARWKEDVSLKNGQGKTLVVSLRQTPQNALIPGRISGTDNGIAIFEGLKMPPATADQNGSHAPTQAAAAKAAGANHNVFTDNKIAEQKAAALKMALTGSGGLDQSQALVGIPSLNQMILWLAFQQIGKKIGNGQCTTFVAAVLYSVGANIPGAYTWGRRLEIGEEWKPGDVIQFTSCRFVRNSANAHYEWFLGIPNHSAIVVSVQNASVVLLHQNVSPDQKVQMGTYNFAELASGALEIYRPQQ